MQPSNQASSAVERLGREFEIAWYETVLDRDPGNLVAIDQLAHAYTATGRYADGLAMDRKLVAAMPDEPMVRYNLACSLSLTGQLDGAIAELLRACALGYDDKAHLMNDVDLEAARTHPKFIEVITAIERNNAKKKKPGKVKREEEDF